MCIRDSIKEASAAAALFIFLNSASGLAGLMHTKFTFQPEIIYWIMGVMVAGFAGSAIDVYKRQH